MDDIFETIAAKSKRRTTLLTLDLEPRVRESYVRFIGARSIGINEILDRWVSSYDLNVYLNQSKSLLIYKNVPSVDRSTMPGGNFGFNIDLYIAETVKQSNTKILPVTSYGATWWISAVK